MDTIKEEFFRNNQLDVASLPHYEEVELISLNPKYLVRLNITTSINMFLLLAGLFGAYLFIKDFKGYFVVAGVLSLLMLFWFYFSNYQLQKRSGYGVRERDIIFKRGFLYEKTTVVPFNRIQHVSTRRSLLDKMLGLSTLKVFTAGGSGSDVAIPGLLPETASNLKEALSERMSGHV